MKDQTAEIVICPNCWFRINTTDEEFDGYCPDCGEFVEDYDMEEESEDTEVKLLYSNDVGSIFEEYREDWDI